MKFQVPQFIEVEDKIFGPLTIKQFIYLAGGAGLTVMFYIFLPSWLAILFIMPAIGFSLALAFYKVNNKPFIFVLEAGFKYLINPKLYIWRHEQTPVMAEPEKKIDVQPAAFIPTLSGGKLKDLSLSLDMKETIAPVPADIKK